VTRLLSFPASGQIAIAQRVHPLGEDWVCETDWRATEPAGNVAE
jgi:hypothetical protein